MCVPEPKGQSGNRRIPAFYQPSDCSHSLWWAPGGAQDVKKQDTCPEKLRCKWKEWFQWAQTLGTAPHSSTLAWKNPMDGGAWWAAVHGVAKSQAWLSDFTFTFHFHALEKEMATHSSVFAWRIPGTEEPGGLPSIGSHRAGHDWSDLAAAAADSCIFLYIKKWKIPQLGISAFL